MWNNTTKAISERAMSALKYLRLSNFKSFAEAEITFSPFSLLIGANASGKSNVRDAIRLLHGISRGYSLDEAMNGKRQGGVRVWTGIRGGSAEICRHGQSQLSLSAGIGEYSYSISIEFVGNARVPKLVDESLNGPDGRLFRLKTSSSTPKGHVEVVLVVDGKHGGQIIPMPRTQSALGQIPSMLDDKGGKDDNAATILRGVNCLGDVLGGVRFSQFSPAAMRKAATPGETQLGRQGENLSTALKEICKSEKHRDRIASWLRRLTPMDVGGFEFAMDKSGRVELSLLERNGNRSSVESVSDGMLRFLAILVAMGSPDTGQTFFLEEVESGIDPSRLNDLMDILLAQTDRNRATVIATTHSPLLLRVLGRRRLQQAHLAYRFKGSTDSQLICLEDVPGIRDKLERYDLGVLHESDWFRKTLGQAAEDA
ncbi:MAG: putative ATPase [Rhodothermales bacterium]|jgi:predicted ATPase